MQIGKLVGQGRTAEIYAVGNDKVVKLFKEGISKQAIEYEYNISKEISDSGFPVVKTYELVEEENKIGVVYDRVNGRTMMEKMATEPFKIYQHAKNFAELHHSMHKGIEGNISSVKDRLIDCINATDLLDSNCKEKLIMYTKKLPDGNNLCHGDFHPDNILNEGEKYYIIDWMTATKGDSLADVARTIIMLKYGVLPDSMARGQKITINLFRKVLLKQYIKHYMKISGVSMQSIKKWQLPVAAARLIEWVPEHEKKKLLEFIHDELEKL